MDEKFIADRITELRLRKNVSEYQMSLDLGKNKSYIQNISSGRSMPSMGQFLEICNYFDITPQQFFDEELHNIPLYQKATDLLKQLDDEDMIAVISILNRLNLRNK
ncbi:helix-turn-helix domain-containing protein [Faecalimonas umbilicata]|nr:helix-turn-helix domain-containing protein [Faecalimonas umbilicata]